MDFASCPCGDPMPRFLELEGRKPVLIRSSDGTPVSTPLPTDMALCMPDDRANADAMVTYHVTGSGPWVITRQVGARTAFMLRSNTRPFFWIDCLDQDGQTVSGHVHVYNLRLSSDSLDPNSAETFSVYYVAPRSGSRGC